MTTRGKPALASALRDYTAGAFRADLASGVTVGLVALPLAVAFGIASGVTPQAGLFTAIVGGFLVSLLGGSRVQIGGPTGAFVVVAAGIVTKYGVNGLLVATMTAGIIVLGLGLTGLGIAVKFVPRPVVVGFTNGIAVLIASTQVPAFFGLRVAGNPGDFLGRMLAIARGFATFDLPTALVACGSLAIVIGVPRVSARMPGGIVAVVAATAATAMFHIDIATVGSRFGPLASGLPVLALPHASPREIISLLPSALTVAMLAAIESLLSAVVADSMTGDRHDSNVELVAIGIANLVTPIFGGIPVTGAIARTATNVRSGARTPISGIVHALTLLAIAVFAAPLAADIPLATLAAILFVVAYNMGEWRAIPTIVRLDNASRSVWLATFALTVVADLSVAVGVGMALAMLLYVYRVSQTTTVSLVTAGDLEDGRRHALVDRVVPDYISIVRIHGPFLFGAPGVLAERDSDLTRLAPIVILRLRNMTAIDATGAHAVADFHARLERSGRALLLCGAREQPIRLLQRTGVVRSIGIENVLPDIESALERARELRFASSAGALRPLVADVTVLP